MSFESDLLAVLEEIRDALQDGIQTQTVSVDVPGARVRVTDGTVGDGTGTGVSMGGDISGPSTDALVVGLRGAPISDVTPSVGDVLVWSGTQWVPQAQPGESEGDGVYRDVDDVVVDIDVDYVDDTTEGTLVYTVTIPSSECVSGRRAQIRLCVYDVAAYGCVPQIWFADTPVAMNGTTNNMYPFQGSLSARQWTIDFVGGTSDAREMIVTYVDITAEGYGQNGTSSDWPVVIDVSSGLVVELKCARQDGSTIIQKTHASTVSL